MIPKRLRRAADDLAYLAVRTLDRETSTRLMAKLLRDQNLTAEPSVLDELVKLADGHPFNFYRIVEECKERGIGPFLANPLDYIEWKHRYSSEYIRKLNFNNAEVGILAILLTVPELDFDAIVTALPMTSADLSDALQRLGSLHVIESNEDRFTIAPNLASRLSVSAEFAFRPIYSRTPSKSWHGRSLSGSRTGRPKLHWWTQPYSRRLKLEIHSTGLLQCSFCPRITFGWLSDTMTKNVGVRASAHPRKR